MVIDRFFNEMGVTPHVLMEADDTEAIKRLVESGFGYSILPEHALRGVFALLSKVSRRRSSPEGEFGTRDGAYRVSSKVDRIHRRFSPDHLGPGLSPSRFL
jgi:DNA-binding transcriptional LysR family regulator